MLLLLQIWAASLNVMDRGCPPTPLKTNAALSNKSLLSPPRAEKHGVLKRQEEQISYMWRQPTFYSWYQKQPWQQVFISLYAKITVYRCSRAFEWRPWIWSPLSHTYSHIIGSHSWDTTSILFSCIGFLQPSFTVLRRSLIPGEISP